MPLPTERVKRDDIPVHPKIQDAWVQCYISSENDDGDDDDDDDDSSSDSVVSRSPEIAWRTHRTNKLGQQLGGELKAAPFAKAGKSMRKAPEPKKSISPNKLSPNTRIQKHKSSWLQKESMVVQNTALESHSPPQAARINSFRPSQVPSKTTSKSSTNQLRLPTSRQTSGMGGYRSMALPSGAIS